jgi:hypothetical protein
MSRSVRMGARPGGKTRAALLLVVALGGCFGGLLAPAADAAAATHSTLSLAKCSARDVPNGFSLDASHSGHMTPAQYSASGDIQASLIFDHFQHGLRDVYTDLATPNTGPNGDQVIECVAMAFSTPQNANRFLQSFEYLRSQAASIVKKVALPGRLAGDSVGYREAQQAFSGYHIASTTVMEVADQHGDLFYDVSIAGPDPTVHSVFGLLKGLAGRS